MSIVKANKKDDYSYEIISNKSVCEKNKVDLDTLIKEATDLFNNLDIKAKLDPEDIEKINTLINEFDDVHKKYYDEINMNFNKKHEELEKKITELRTFLTSKNGNLIPVAEQKPVVEEKKGFFRNLFTKKEKGGKHNTKRKNIKTKSKKQKNKKQKTKKFNRRK